MSANAYLSAQEQYARLGVDTEVVLETLGRVPISLQCWQGDDVGGFEHVTSELTGGIQATGNYPGKARTAEELRRDLETAVSLIPGRHRVNLHACYAELDGRKIERNAYTIEQFASWVDWARARNLGLDFNPTYFSHPLSADGFTLAHRDEGVRRYWIEHGIACRKIAAEMGRRLGRTVITNFWIPDGSKDTTVSRRQHRESILSSIVMPSRASFSGSVASPSRSGPTSFTWGTRSEERRSSASMRDIFIPQNPSRTRFPPC
jgi:L-rhamnose isomerase